MSSVEHVHVDAFHLDFLDAVGESRDALVVSAVLEVATGECDEVPAFSFECREGRDVGEVHLDNIEILHPCVTDGSGDADEEREPEDGGWVGDVVFDCDENGDHDSTEEYDEAVDVVASQCLLLPFFHVFYHANIPERDEDFVAFVEVEVAQAPEEVFLEGLLLLHHLTYHVFDGVVVWIAVGFWHWCFLVPGVGDGKGGE